MLPNYALDFSDEKLASSIRDYGWFLDEWDVEYLKGRASPVLDELIERLVKPANELVEEPPEQMTGIGGDTDIQELSDNPDHDHIKYQYQYHIISGLPQVNEVDMALPSDLDIQSTSQGSAHPGDVHSDTSQVISQGEAQTNLITCGKSESSGASPQPTPLPVKVVRVERGEAGQRGVSETEASEAKPKRDRTPKMDAWRDLTRYGDEINWPIDKISVQVFADKNTGRWSAKIEINQPSEGAPWEYVFSGSLVSNARGEEEFTKIMNGGYDLSDEQQNDYVAQCLERISPYLGGNGHSGKWKMVSFMSAHHSTSGNTPKDRPLHIVMFVNMMNNQKQTAINLSSIEYTKDKIWMGDFLLFIGDKMFTGSVSHGAGVKGKKAPLYVHGINKKKYSSIFHANGFTVALEDEGDFNPQDFDFRGDVE